MTRKYTVNKWKRRKPRTIKYYKEFLGWEYYYHPNRKHWMIKHLNVVKDIYTHVDDKFKTRDDCIKWLEDHNATKQRKLFHAAGAGRKDPRLLSKETGRGDNC